MSTEESKEVVNDIIIIAAVSENNVIGLKGGIPWHIGEDLKRFKKLTIGHTIVMGRKTYESLPNGPLKGRKNIVLSKRLEYDPEAEGVLVCGSLNEALIHSRYEEKVFIIGGEEIYKDALDYVDFLELTVVDGEYEGDAFFPFVDFSLWNLISDVQGDGCKFQSYAKKTV